MRRGGRGMARGAEAGRGRPVRRERRWRRYKHLDPYPPLGGSPLTIVWEMTGEVVRTTITSQVVGCFWDDPAAGPFAWEGGPAQSATSTLGLVLIDGAGLVTPTAWAAHVLSSLANAGIAHD